MVGVSRSLVSRPVLPAILSLLLALIVGLVVVLPVALAQQAPRTGIVISEFRFRGPTGGNDEFVELRNTSAAPIDISGYKLQGCSSSSGAASDRATVPAGTTVRPGGSFLFTNDQSGTPTPAQGGEYSGVGGTGQPEGDVDFTTGFTDLQATNQSGARIVEASGTVVDGVGSPNSPCREGTGITTPTAAGDQSFERNAGGNQDTNDNQADFVGPKAGVPQNSGTAEPPVVPTPINEVQGDGQSSPRVGETVTVRGVVTGIDNEVGQSSSGRTFANERGIFVQEEPGADGNPNTRDAGDEGDGDPDTSEGIFVGEVENPEDFYTPQQSGGQETNQVVTVTGEVRELFGFTIIEADAQPVSSGTFRTPEPVQINENQANGQDAGTRPYYESLESMRVGSQTSTANSGGTNKFDELFLTPGSERDKVFRDETVPSLFATDEDAGSGDPRNPDDPNNPKSTTVVNADIHDTVVDLAGPLAFNFGNFKVMVQEDLEPSVRDTGSPYTYTFERPRDRASLFPGLRRFRVQQEIRVVSYNLNNYFDNVDDPNKDDEFDQTTDFEPEKRRRAVNAINTIMRRPDVIAVQEAENKGVLDRLAAELGGYTAYLEEGNDSRGIDNGFLIKTGPETRVQSVSNVRQLGKTEPEPSSIPENVECSDEEGLLFDRPPLVADITTKDGAKFTIFGNHFAAKGGTGPEGGRGECREAQAQLLRERVQILVNRGRQAIVAGDLNSFEDERPLEVLEQNGLMDNQFDKEVPDQRYSFQFQGKLQTLDHILITRGLNSRYEDFQYAHFNIDYFERERPENQFSTDGHKLSVHDPPILTLN